MGGGNIKQDSSYRLVSDVNITTWNNKANSNHTHTSSQITDFGTHVYDATQSRSANTVLAAPNGSTGAATFRALEIADVYNLQSTLDGKAASNHGHPNLTCGSLSIDDNGAYIYALNNDGNIHFRYRKNSTADYSYADLASMISRIDNIQQSFNNILFSPVTLRYQYNGTTIQFIYTSNIYLPNSQSYTIVGTSSGAFVFTGQKSDGTQVTGTFGGIVKKTDYGFFVLISNSTGDPGYWFHTLYPDIQAWSMAWQANYNG